MTCKHVCFKQPSQMWLLGWAMHKIHTSIGAGLLSREPASCETLCVISFSDIMLCNDNGRSQAILHSVVPQTLMVSLQMTDRDLECVWAGVSIATFLDLQLGLSSTFLHLGWPLLVSPNAELRYHTLHCVLRIMLHKDCFTCWHKINSAAALVACDHTLPYVGDLLYS